MVCTNIFGENISYTRQKYMVLTNPIKYIENCLATGMGSSIYTYFGYDTKKTVHKG